MLESIDGRAGAARWRGVLFAAALALLAALGAVSATGASALGEQCSGGKAKGMGSFLQTRAQQQWSFGKFGFNAASSPLACSGSQGSGGTPQVSHVPLSSAGALRHWGAEDGSLHTPAGFRFLANLISTDIAPSGPVGEEGSMLAKMKAALGSDVAVVPVTQTSDRGRRPPAAAARACRLRRFADQQRAAGEGVQRPDQELAPAGGSVGLDARWRLRPGDHPNRPRRKLRHHLPVQALPELDRTRAARLHGRSETDLGTAAGAVRRRNLAEPGMAAQSRLPGRRRPGDDRLRPDRRGGGGPLGYVRDTPGTITYGSLPEAQQQAPEQIVDVHNGVKFAGPENSEGGANCGAAKYTRPAGWKAASTSTGHRSTGLTRTSARWRKTPTRSAP